MPFAVAEHQELLGLGKVLDRQHVVIFSPG